MSRYPPLCLMFVLSIAIIFSSTSSSLFSLTFATSNTAATTTSLNTTFENNTDASVSDLFTSSVLSEQDQQNKSTSNFEISNRIKTAINDRVENNNSNAAIVIGFVDPNGTQFYGYGKLSNMSKEAVDENTIFSIGSTTKVFTTILLADMVNQGLIKLNDPIEKYLPLNISVPQFNGHKITIEDLATHTSGLSEFPPNFCSSFDPAKNDVQDSVSYRISLFNCTKDYDFNQFYQALSNFTLTREPGSKVEYSTFGIGLLGHILALKSNMSSFDELLKDDILDVLGMNDTGFVLSGALKSRVAVGHFNGEELPSVNLSNPIAPGGALHSTASDMVKFLSANMGLMKTDLNDAMQESHLIRMSTGQILPNNLQLFDKNNNIGLYVGLGWFVTTNYGHQVIWHNGATIGGYNAYMAFNPSTERGIVILCSTDIADINITTISFSQNDKLSNLIWALLNAR